MRRGECPPGAGFGQLCRMSNSAVHPLASATDYSRLAEPQPALAVAWTQHSRNCEKPETVNKLEKKREEEGGRERRAVLTSQSWPAPNGQLIVVESLGELVALLQQQTTGTDREKKRKREAEPSLQLGRFLGERL